LPCRGLHAGGHGAFCHRTFRRFFALAVHLVPAIDLDSRRPYILRTADNRSPRHHLSSLEKFWDGLIAALEAPELAADQRFSDRQARITNYELLNAELDQRFSRKT